MKEDGDVEFSSPKPPSAFQTIPESNVVKAVTAPGGSIVIPHTITTVTLCSNSPHPFANPSGSSSVTNGNGSSLHVQPGTTSSSQVPITAGASVHGTPSLVTAASQQQQQLQSHSFYITQQPSTNSKGSSEVSFAQAQQQSPSGVFPLSGGNATSQPPQLMQAQSASPCSNFPNNSPSSNNLNSNRNTSQLPTSKPPSSTSSKQAGTNNSNCVTNPTVSQHLGAPSNSVNNANNLLNATNNNNNISNLNNHNGTSGSGAAPVATNSSTKNNYSGGSTNYNNNNGTNSSGELAPSSQQNPFTSANNHVNVIASAGGGNLPLATSGSAGALPQVPVALLAVPNNCQTSGSNNNNNNNGGTGQAGTMLQQQQPPMNLSFPRIPPSPDSG